MLLEVICSLERMHIEIKTENRHLGAEDKICNGRRIRKGHVVVPGFGEKHTDGHRPIMS